MPDPETPSDAARGPRIWAVILAVLGGLMLLPGACGVFFAAVMLSDIDDPFNDVAVWFSVPGMIIGLVGLFLLRWAMRRYRALRG